MEKQWRRWRLGVVVLAMGLLVGCTTTVDRLKKQGVEFDSGKVMRVYRF